MIFNVGVNSKVIIKLVSFLMIEEFDLYNVNKDFVNKFICL